MNKVSAKNVKEFAVIISNVGITTNVRVPGHEGRKYDVSITRNGGMRVSCTKVTSYKNPKTAFKSPKCLGNYRTVCYHSIAAVEMIAENKGHRILGWCESRNDAKRLYRLHSGSYFTRVSSGNGEVWFVGVAPNESDPVREQAAEYVRLYDEAQAGELSWQDERLKELTLEFAARNWNYSMVSRYARAGENAATEVLK